VNRATKCIQLALSPPKPFLLVNGGVKSFGFEVTLLRLSLLRNFSDGRVVPDPAQQRKVKSEEYRFDADVVWVGAWDW
jgi:hypothetical protein